MEKPVKMIVYVRGGICIDVITNLPDDSWEYALVDYDNEPGLSDNHVPFDKIEMRTLPSMVAVHDLIQAATSVIENRESDDLVRRMKEILTLIKLVSKENQNHFTVFGYRADHKCPFASWVAASTADEAKVVIGQQEPAVVVCGIVKGWTRID